MDNEAAEVVLEVDGRELRGWESVSITRAVDRLAGSFSLTVSELEPDDPLARELAVGASCTVRLGDDVVVTGHIEARAVTYSGSEHTVGVSGRDSVADLVDASADRSPGQWQKQTIDKIVEDLVSPFDGIKLLPVANPGPEFEVFRLQPGEQVHAAISRGCRMRGLAPNSDGQGGLRLWQPGEDLAPTTIDRALLGAGETIKAAIREDSRNRFSVYRVKGQTDNTGQWTEKSGPAQEGTATDPGVTRFRPLVILETAKGDTGSLRRRAQFEATTRAARSWPVSFRLRKWRSATGWLWQPGFRVPVFDPILGVGTVAGAPRELLISSVTYTLDDRGGQVVDLELLDPVAFRVLELAEQPVPGSSPWQEVAP